eukprot:283055-Hanusia_phi.AAC.1
MSRLIKFPSPPRTQLELESRCRWLLARPPQAAGARQDEESGNEKEGGDRGERKTRIVGREKDVRQEAKGQRQGRTKKR